MMEHYFLWKKIAGKFLKKSMPKATRPAIVGNSRTFSASARWIGCLENTLASCAIDAIYGWLGLINYHQFKMISCNGSKLSTVILFCRLYNCASQAS